MDFYMLGEIRGYLAQAPFRIRCQVLRLSDILISIIDYNIRVSGLFYHLQEQPCVYDKFFLFL